MGIEEITGRIARDLEHLKQYTATPGNGCTRLPFTEEARHAVEYLKELMMESGLEVTIDAAGNVIGVLKGEDEDAPCVMMGSHYDSVYNGGDYDGIAGVICAIEVARLLKEEGISNVSLIAFTQNDIGNAFWNTIGWNERQDLNYYDFVLNTENITAFNAQ